MSLATGSRLGPYEIVSPLGAGGMGEVYKARDTRLDPTVAIKIEGVAANARGAAQVAMSSNGTLVYLTGSGAGDMVPISWMDRGGNTTPLRITPANWSNPSFAPDGRQIAFDIFDGTRTDVWVYEWATDRLSRLTSGDGDSAMPVWTPDGRRIVFRSNRDNKAAFNLYWQRADGPARSSA